MFWNSKYRTRGTAYTIPQIDLSTRPDGADDSLSELFTQTTVDAGQGYLGHPDSVLLKDGSILTFFPEGHGKGKTLSRISHDGGKSYPDTIENPPKVRLFPLHFLHKYSTATCAHQNHAPAQSCRKHCPPRHKSAQSQSRRAG